MKVCYIRPVESSKNRDLKLYKRITDLIGLVGITTMGYTSALMVNNGVSLFSELKNDAIPVISRSVIPDPKMHWIANIQTYAITLTAIGCGAQLYVAYREARKKDMPFIVLKWGAGILIALAVPLVAELLF